MADRRVLALGVAFLQAGILGEDRVERDTATGTPQGGILSPLLANILQHPTGCRTGCIPSTVAASGGKDSE